MDTATVMAGVSMVQNAWNGIAWLLQHTADGTVLNAVLGIAAAGVSWIGLDRHLKSTKAVRLFSIFKRAVRRVGTAYVMPLKHGSDDGVLTLEERAEARARAWEEAKKIAREEENIDLAKEVGSDVARELTEMAVRFWKSRGAKTA